MELNDILSLVKAGYTREEIKAMESPAVPDAVPNGVPILETVQNPQPSPTPVNEPVTVAEPVPQPVPQDVQPTMAELMQSIAKLTSAVQANAIAQSVIPGGANPQTPTAEDMLAEIIRPTFKAREG